MGSLSSCAAAFSLLERAHSSAAATKKALGPQTQVSVDQQTRNIPCEYPFA